VDVASAAIVFVADGNRRCQCRDRHCQCFSGRSYCKLDFSDPRPLGWKEK
jgi:hypothetical protein